MPEEIPRAQRPQSEAAAEEQRSSRTVVQPNSDLLETRESYTTELDASEYLVVNEGLLRQRGFSQIAF